MTSPSYTDFDLPGVAEDALAEYDRHERTGTLEDWARKWGREMAMHLVSSTAAEDVDDLRGELAAEEEACGRAEQEAKDLRSTILDVISKLEAAL